jgi:C-terminal processing protease CtpA/Prc
MWAYKARKDPTHSGRVVVIVDEGCNSATDLLVSYLAENRDDVRIVGRPTGGAVGGAGGYAVLRHSDARVHYPVTRWFSTNGRLLEGAGTKPHVWIEHTFDTVLRRVDPFLEAALREARR